MALLTPVLIVGCSPPNRAVDSAPLELRFNDDPASESFGTLLLAPVDGIDGINEWAAGEVGEREAIVVWTGRVEPAGDGCNHPDGQPTLLGHSRPHPAGLRFEPRLPFVRGMTYTACVDLDRLERAVPGMPPGDRARSTLQLTFELPEIAVQEAPRVTAIWPVGESVPENLLRFYIHFSQPMRTRSVADQITLLDVEGEVIEESFVEIPDGLWDARSTRLTLFLHPGRIKRGVGPRESLGPALRAGQTVRLRIDGGLKSQAGVLMASPVERVLHVAAPDRVSPDPGRWLITAPRSPVDPVTVRFDEPLDRAQLALFASVRGPGGELLRGASSATEDGLAWSFTPAHGWQAGSYRLLARRSIEDLAGNTPDRLFDVETPGPERSASSTRVSAPSPGAHEVIELPFEVRFGG